MKKNKLLTYAAIAYLGLTTFTTSIPVQASTLKEKATYEIQNFKDAISYFKYVKDNGIPDEPVSLDVIRGYQAEEKVDKDTASSEYFEERKAELDTFVKNEKLIKAKQRAKDIFKDGVDFIFYDGELKIYGENKKGVKYKNLKDATQESIYETVDDTRKLINQLFPDLMDTLDEKYIDAAEYMEEAEYSMESNKTSIVSEKETSKKNSEDKTFKDYAKDEIGGFNEAIDYFKKFYQNKTKK